jgi:hypothetical protein
MSSLLGRVLPYLKASVAEENGSVVCLSGDESPILEPYVGSLLISYVVDEGSTLRLLTEGERKTSGGVPPAQLRRASIANLVRRVAAQGVRLVPQGGIFAVLFDGNFEATLMLCDDLWPHLHAQLGPTIAAVAPARDVLAVSSPERVSELREVVSRVWPGGDHLLTQEVFLRGSSGWSVGR